ncbi:MAG: hypothetical protein A2Y09_00815 [Planctomycetes bacterium GWA2_39_15]|nr:MAG: hypothetical protein A2Y09_00815 [Planctomycetes bacterium GWA2_39_15]
MSRYHRLNVNEREEIALGLAQGRSQHDISVSAIHNPNESEKKVLLFPHTKPPRHKDLWYIPMPPPVPFIEGEKGGGIPSFIILCGFVSLCDYFSPI